MTSRTEDRNARSPAPGASGLVVGGLGGPEDELLESGQEEVFSRTEVESGRIEHHVEAGGDAVDETGETASTGGPQGDRNA